MSIDYTTILSRKYSGSEWTLNGENYEGLVWLSDSKKPTKTELDKLWPLVLEEIAAEKQAKENAKAALLERLGITAEDAIILLS